MYIRVKNGRGKKTHSPITSRCSLIYKSYQLSNDTACSHYKVITFKTFRYHGIRNNYNARVIFLSKSFIENFIVDYPCAVKY